MPADGGPTRGPDGRRRRPTAMAVAAGLAVTAMLAAAAVGSGAAADERGQAVQVRLPTMGALGDALLVALGIAAAAVLLVSILLGGRRGRRVPGHDLHSLAQLAMFIVLAVILFSLPRFRPEEPVEPEEPPAAGVEVDDGVVGEELPSASAGDVALVALVLLVGAAVAAGAMARGRQGDPVAADDGGDASAARALSDLLDDAAEDLRTAGDPRRAVIAAYDGMERVVGAHGLPRRPAEAPLEYLARCLGEVDASGPAIARLTALFQQAMFSSHPIGRPMQDDAVDALLAVRDELRVLR